MRKSNLLFLGVLAATVTISCKDSAKSTEESFVEQHVVETQEMKQAVVATDVASFGIKGMTCEIGCARLIQDKLAALEGVSSAKVDFESNSAIVEFDKGIQSEDKIKETVQKIANGSYVVEEMTVEAVAQK